MSQREIKDIAARLLDCCASDLHGTESHILQTFKMLVQSRKNFEDRIKIDGEVDTFVYEMAFKYGRADIVIFHVDGSASVIEVKDGTKGYSHVVAGIGQAALYSSQLINSKSVLTKVRKCLLWTSTGDIALDAQIEIACEKSNTIALPWQSLKMVMAHNQAVRMHFGADRG